MKPLITALAGLVVGLIISQQLAILKKTAPAAVTVPPSKDSSWPDFAKELVKLSTGIVFVVGPDQLKLGRIASIVQPGDGLLLISDGKKHYWDDQPYFTTKTNVYTYIYGLHCCSGWDDAGCDVVDFWSLMDMDIWDETREYQKP